MVIDKSDYFAIIQVPKPRLEYPSDRRTPMTLFRKKVKNLMSLRFQEDVDNKSSSSLSVPNRVLF